jgi:Leucine-rich repeat (LRR) protein
MQKNRSLPFLLFSLILLLTIWGQYAHAQIGQCPRIYREGETLRTDPAQSYQWYRNGEIIPSATQETYTPTGRSANYSVQVEGKASTPFAFELGQVTLIGQAFDEHLRPVANARIAVGSQTTQSDVQGRFQLGPINAATTILLHGEKTGHWAAQRRITPTGRQTHVQLMLRSQPFEHELEATRGGTISRGAFFLTLQPNGVLDANNQRYTGVVKIALNGGRPDDPHFGWMMPGGDFMAQDAQGRERILQSYGFLSAHLQTPNGQPLKLDPNIGAQLRFVMPHTMVASAPDSMPLWHFDEVAGIWKEEGYTRREGAAYVGTVRHFSSWNCDWPGPWCLLRGKTVDCKGRPVAGAPLRFGQQIITSDSVGNYSGRVPATLRFDIQSMNGIGKITVGPFEEGSENEVAVLAGGSNMYGFGVIDVNQQLAIYLYGNRGSTEYSIDGGMTYQFTNRFQTDIDSSYQLVVRDSTGCILKLPYVRLPKVSACQMLDSLGFAQAIWHYSISSALESSEPVYKLGFSLNKETSFPNYIFDYFPCLQYLQTYGNLPVADELQESIGNLSQLRHLSIMGNQVVNLPESIGNLTQLESLSLDHNQLDRFPDAIGNLTNLKQIGASNNKIETLVDSLVNLKELTSISLHTNKLSSLPDSLGKLINLTFLELYDNQINSLPESFGSLIKLKYLDLHNNRLTSLSESIGNLVNLDSINLSSNRLTSLPESIGSISNLMAIRVEDNLLSSLPMSLGNLINLYTLELSRNNLQEIPSYFENFRYLSSLKISKNHLSNLPENFGNLPTLYRLELDSNQLRTVPESIGNLKELYFLSLNNNKLTSLPVAIGNLPRLMYLNLSSNQLTDLPESIYNLTGLSYLNLSSNQLTDVSESLVNLIYLRFLNLQNNPIPPAEIERIRRLLPNCLVVF